MVVDVGAAAGDGNVSLVHYRTRDFWAAWVVVFGVRIIVVVVVVVAVVVEGKERADAVAAERAAGACVGRLWLGIWVGCGGGGVCCWYRCLGA